MRFLLTVILFFCFTPDLLSQLAAGDSVVKTIMLDEVNIFDQKDQNTSSFNFYRTNRMANTDEIMARMLGVNMIRRGAYGSEPILRNYGAGQTNLTIDGMRIYGACTDKMDPVSIYVEPINLQAINVAQGSAGAQFGSTIGGQINMKLGEPDFSCHRYIKGQFSQSYSTVNKAVNSSLSLNHSSSRLAYRMSAVFRKASDYTAGSDVKVFHSGYKKANVSASLIYRYDSLQSFKIDYLGDWGKNIGYPALPMDVGKADAQIFSISHKLLTKGKFLISNETKIYLNSIYHEMDDSQRPEAPMHMDMPGWSETVGFYDELYFKGDWMLRVDGHHVKTRADMTMYPVGEPVMYMQTLPENSLSDLGMFLQKKIDFKKNQQLLLSARMDVFHQYAESGPGAMEWMVFNVDATRNVVNVLKNIHVSYRKGFGRVTSLQFGGGYAERLPTSNERYGYYLYNRQDQYDYLGNIELKPENALQAELQFKQEFKRIMYSINFFYHHTNNLIYAYKLEGYSQMTIGAYGLKTFKNIGYGISKGFEGTVKMDILDQLCYLASVKFVYAQTNSGVPLPLVPPFKLQEALRYTYRLFQIQLEHDYAAAQNRINVDYGDKVTPSFNLLNLRISRNIRIKSNVLQLGIACENILDKYYWEHLDIGQVARPGRNFLFNLNFLF